jgi:hypothetical protein
MRNLGEIIRGDQAILAAHQAGISVHLGSSAFRCPCGHKVSTRLPGWSRQVREHLWRNPKCEAAIMASGQAALARREEG